jgi:hypothetical protein
MSLCLLSYLGGVLDRASAISCGSDAVTCPVTGQIISNQLSGLATLKTPSIDLLNKYISMVYHHQLIATDIQQKIHTTIWINISKFYL